MASHWTHMRFAPSCSSRPGRSDTQRLLRRRVVLLAIGHAVVAAVDPAGQLAEVTGVGEPVEVPRTPVPPGGPKPDVRLGGHRRIALQIQTQRLAGRPVVGPAGEL